jgi:hypothetical protein
MVFKKEDRQHNSQKKKRTVTKNDLKNSMQKNKNQATWTTSLKLWMSSGVPSEAGIIYYYTEENKRRRCSPCVVLTSVSFRMFAYHRKNPENFEFSLSWFPCFSPKTGVRKKTPKTTDLSQVTGKLYHILYRVHLTLALLELAMLVNQE